MIQRKDKVTHPIHGNGIVENLSNNESIAMVDFKGVMKRCEASNLQKGANEYTPKQTPEAIKVLVEIQKLQEKYQSEYEQLFNADTLPHPQLMRLNLLKEVINDLENILQGTNK